MEEIAENHFYKTIKEEASGLKKHIFKVRDEPITLRGYSDPNTGEFNPPANQITGTVR